ncbi:MAG TPA: hypothetical protein VNN25_20020 [Thermoanaerobaculia bacterium]|nr:hypothetical protein [Thermoanaerobaculia bacterium]
MTVFREAFEVVGRIEAIETIASGSGIRDLQQLIDAYGPGRWRKLKGVATVRVESGRIRLAELHWYEAHGIGKRDMKVKRYFD